MHHENWRCSKCKNQEFETEKFRATGGNFAKIFDIQNKKFTTVICIRCRFSEVYSTESSRLMNVFDFFTS